MLVLVLGLFREPSYSCGAWRISTSAFPCVQATPRTGAAGASAAVARGAMGQQGAAMVQRGWPEAGFSAGRPAVAEHLGMEPRAAGQC